MQRTQFSIVYIIFCLFHIINAFFYCIEKYSSTFGKTRAKQKQILIWTDFKAFTGGWMVLDTSRLMFLSHPPSTPSMTSPGIYVFRFRLTPHCSNSISSFANLFSILETVSLWTSLLLNHFSSNEFNPHRRPVRLWPCAKLCHA